MHKDNSQTSLKVADDLGSRRNDINSKTLVCISTKMSLQILLVLQFYSQSETFARFAIVNYLPC